MKKRGKVSSSNNHSSNNHFSNNNFSSSNNSNLSSSNSNLSDGISNGHSSGSSNGNGYQKHPILHPKLTFGQKAADKLAEFAGSWKFILTFIFILIIWVAVNSWMLLQEPFDPYPFILLNLVLSTIAALQAPVILMAENREAQRDRQSARYDYQVNRRAEREIQVVMKELQAINAKINNLKR